MSVTYLVAPLLSENLAWFDQTGIARPPVSADYRMPTTTEVWSVLTKLPGYSFSVTHPEKNCCDFFILSAGGPMRKRWGTVLIVSDDPQKKVLSFHGGRLELIFLIIDRLTQICGPLAVADDSYPVPYLVTGSIPIRKMIEEYNSRASQRPIRPPAD